MLVRAPRNHLWWMPSQSKPLSHFLFHTNCSAISSQNLSGSLSKLARSAAQSWSRACSFTIDGAGYSSTATVAVSGGSDNFVAVLIEKHLVTSITSVRAEVSRIENGA